MKELDHQGKIDRMRRAITFWRRVTWSGLVMMPASAIWLIAVRRPDFAPIMVGSFGLYAVMLGYGARRGAGRGLEKLTGVAARAADPRLRRRRRTWLLAGGDGILTLIIALVLFANLPTWLATAGTLLVGAGLARTIRYLSHRVR